MIEVAGFLRPKPGERSCGDAWWSIELPGGGMVAIVDGLGHGESAARAAETAIGFLNEATAQVATPDLESLILALHDVLRPTRGVVAGLAAIDCSRREIQYAGIGNTEVRTFGGEPAKLFSRAGLLGSGQRLRPVVQVGEFSPGTTLVLHTDGVDGMGLGSGFLRAPCAELARRIVEQHGRDHDDAAVVVARCGGLR